MSAAGEAHRLRLCSALVWRVVGGMAMGRRIEVWDCVGDRTLARCCYGAGPVARGMWTGG